MLLKPIFDGVGNTLLIARRKVQLNSQGLGMMKILKPIREFEERHKLTGAYRDHGDDLPVFAPQDENARFVAGSWEEMGKSYHQFVAKPLRCPDELLEALEWCEQNGRSLVNRNGLHGLATTIGWNGRHVDVVMIFTDLSEATHARLRWG